jgi:hypothetical protein
MSLLNSNSTCCVGVQHIAKKGPDTKILPAELTNNFQWYMSKFTELPPEYNGKWICVFESSIHLLAECTSIEDAFKKARESNFPFKCLLILHGCFDLPVIQTRTNCKREAFYGKPKIQSDSLVFHLVSDPERGGLWFNNMIVDTGADIVTIFNHSDIYLDKDCFRYAIVANHIGYDQLSLSLVIDGYCLNLMPKMIHASDTNNELYRHQEYKKRECLIATDLNIHILWHLYHSQKSSKEIIYWRSWRIR